MHLEREQGDHLAGANLKTLVGDYPTIDALRGKPDKNADSMPH